MVTIARPGDRSSRAYAEGPALAQRPQHGGRLIRRTPEWHTTARIPITIAVGRFCAYAEGTSVAMYAGMGSTGRSARVRRARPASPGRSVDTAVDPAYAEGCNCAGRSARTRRGAVSAGFGRCGFRVDPRVRGGRHPNDHLIVAATGSIRAHAEGTSSAGRRPGAPRVDPRTRRADPSDHRMPQQWGYHRGSAARSYAATVTASS